MTRKSNVYANRGKRWVQRRVYQQFLNPTLGPADTLVCMPSHTCWDLQYINKLRKRREIKKIVAIEQDPEIAKSIRARLSEFETLNISVYEGSVKQYLRETTDCISAVYLDYCSNFGHSLLDDMGVLLGNTQLDLGARVAVAFYGSRESLVDAKLQNDLIQRLRLRLSIPGEYEVANAGHRRSLAFNALLCEANLVPASFPGFCVRVSYPPEWTLYNSKKADMLTASFVVQGRSLEPSVPASKDWWVGAWDNVKEEIEFIRHRHEKPKYAERDKAIYNARLSGLKYREIAEQFDISLGRVGDILRRERMRRNSTTHVISTRVAVQTPKETNNLQHKDVIIAARERGWAWSTDDTILEEQGLSSRTHVVLCKEHHQVPISWRRHKVRDLETLMAIQTCDDNRCDCK